MFRLYFDKCEDFLINDSLCKFLWRDHDIVFLLYLGRFLMRILIFYFLYLTKFGSLKRNNQQKFADYW